MFQATGKHLSSSPASCAAYVEGADDPDAELEDREAIAAAARRGRRRRAAASSPPSGHTTQPPARYTEASLVKELEERGIGRPSTYASVIETILTTATTSGRRAPRSSRRGPRSRRSQLLERHFAHLVDYDFTATMEEALDAIARGEGEAEKWLHSFYFGNGQRGPAATSSPRSTSPTIDPAEVNTVHDR